MRLVPLRRMRGKFLLAEMKVQLKKVAVIKKMQAGKGKTRRRAGRAFLGKRQEAKGSRDLLSLLPNAYCLLP